LKTWGY